MEFRTVHDIELGEEASLTKTISESDVYLFAGITGDLNPAHINAEYMKTTPFKQRLVHGVLTTGLISAALAMKLPGPGGILLAINMKFTAPVFFGDTITAKVKLTEKNIDKNRLKLKTICQNQNGQIVVDGEAFISPYVKR